MNNTVRIIPATYTFLLSANRVLLEMVEVTVVIRVDIIDDAIISENDNSVVNNKVVASSPTVKK
jgi:hypothetical protein